MLFLKNGARLSLSLIFHQNSFEDKGVDELCEIPSNHSVSASAVISGNTNLLRDVRRIKKLPVIQLCSKFPFHPQSLRINCVLKTKTTRLVGINLVMQIILSCYTAHTGILKLLLQYHAGCEFDPMLYQQTESIGMIKQSRLVISDTIKNFIDFVAIKNKPWYEASTRSRTETSLT